MKTSAALLVLIASSVCAQETAPQSALRANGDYADPDGIWRLAVNGGKIPINKDYADLSPEHKALVRSAYPGMSAEDEPPYPKGGTEVLLRPILKAQRLVYGQGPLKVTVAVDTDGKAQSVRTEGTPGKQIVAFTSKLMFSTEFKPAMCKGAPCAGDYKFSIMFKRE